MLPRAQLRSVSNVLAKGLFCSCKIRLRRHRENKGELCECIADTDGVPEEIELRALLNLYEERRATHVGVRMRWVFRDRDERKNCGRIAYDVRFHLRVSLRVCMIGSVSEYEAWGSREPIPVDCIEGIEL